MNNFAEPELGETMLNNIVDNSEQRGQQNIVQSCCCQGTASDGYKTLKYFNILSLL